MAVTDARPVVFVRVAVETGPQVLMKKMMAQIAAAAGKSIAANATAPGGVSEPCNPRFQNQATPVFKSSAWEGGIVVSLARADRSPRAHDD